MEEQVGKGYSSNESPRILLCASKLKASQDEIFVFMKFIGEFSLKIQWNFTTVPFLCLTLLLIILSCKFYNVLCFEVRIVMSYELYVLLTCKFFITSKISTFATMLELSKFGWNP